MFAKNFSEKWDHYFSGMPPVVAPEGDLVFMGKPSSPFILLIDGIYICTINWGVGYVNDIKRLEKSFLRV
jgi:hypothetical protein